MADVLEPREGPADLTMATAALSESALVRLFTFMERIVGHGGYMQHLECMGDIQASTPSVREDICPCLTRTRAAEGGHWSFKRRRFLNVRELEALQGIPPGRIVFDEICTARQYGAMLGNAYTAPVCGRIGRSLLQSAGLVSEICDPWC